MGVGVGVIGACVALNNNYDNSLHSHSCTHSPTHPLTHSPAHSLTHSHSVIHSLCLTHSLTHSLTLTVTATATPTATRSGEGSFINSSIRSTCTLWYLRQYPVLCTSALKLNFVGSEWQCGWRASHDAGGSGGCSGKVEWLTLTYLK